MRKLFVTVALFALVLGAFGAGSAGASSKKPVTLDGKVNAHGTKDISKKSFATLEVEEDDFYISPTYTKVKPGEKITIKLKNDGKAQHTFTSDDLSIDQQVAPGKSTKFTVTIPKSGEVFEIHCNFHGSMGMRAAFYTKAGGH